uniref:Anion exchange protein n=1 Tax=Romanomermis culicivorax TaxID=13658 RepID=A0A915I906_ROMCU
MSSGFSYKKVGIKRSVHEIHAEGLQYTGRPFGGLREDIARKFPYWISDFTAPFLSVNAFSQCLAASLYLFFANFTNIITFGGIMGKMLDDQIAVIECIISGCISGLIFGSFSGQPLNIMSATGPVLIFETIFYKFCGSHKWAFLPARFWLGFWTSIFLFILVAFDASFLVAYITRFTEESFATLIAVIFIFESFQALMNLAGNAPITTNLTYVLRDPCRCMLNETSTNWWTNVTDLHECSSVNGTLKGAMCRFQPDVFTFSLVLFTLTFILAYTFHVFRNSRFFPSKVRSFVADFNVFITIVIMTIFSFCVGVPVETLNVPTNFKPSMDRSWLIDLSDLADWWIILVCIFPGIFLTVLIVMDQQITAVIVNRKDNKLKRGFGYHLDLAFVAVLVLLCSLFGLPFFVAATILSITHVQSLRIESECSAPGEKPRFLGVREQRVTAIFAHLLIGISIFLAPVQKYIPIAVLLGIFLYMGVTTMLTQQFVERILLFFTPVKYQPDYVFLRIVPLKRVFLFTAIQLGAFTLLCAVKYSKDISMLFPILLVVLVFVRKWLDRIFSQKELMAMDDILPAFAALVKRKTPSVSLPCALNSRLTSAVERDKNEQKLLI